MGKTITTYLIDGTPQGPRVDGKRVLKLNKRFDSPSAASVFCLGRSLNGWQDWHNANGTPLKSLLNTTDK